MLLLSNLPILNAFLKKYKINQIINKFLKGDKFIEDNGLFTENKEKIKKFKATGGSRYIYQN